MPHAPHLAPRMSYKTSGRGRYHPATNTTLLASVGAGVAMPMPVPPKKRAAGIRPSPLAEQHTHAPQKTSSFFKTRTGLNPQQAGATTGKHILWNSISQA
jgi:hypothetical protein